MHGLLLEYKSEFGTPQKYQTVLANARSRARTPRLGWILSEVAACQQTRTTCTYSTTTRPHPRRIIPQTIPISHNAKLYSKRNIDIPLSDKSIDTLANEFCYYTTLQPKSFTHSVESQLRHGSFATLTTSPDTQYFTFGSSLRCLNSHTLGTLQNSVTPKLLLSLNISKPINSKFSEWERQTRAAWSIYHSVQHSGHAYDRRMDGYTPN
jgi:hypothetical protein